MAERICGCSTIDRMPRASERSEPYHHDRAKEASYFGGSIPLYGKQGDQDETGQRNDIRRSSLGGHIQPLNCGEDRNGWGNDTITIKQGRTEGRQ